MVTDEYNLVKTFNERYINIIEKSCRIKPKNIASEYSITDDKLAMQGIIKH